MTVDEVRERVQQIRNMAGDDERAHSAEDALHQEVLLAIADGEAEDMRGISREALTTKDIDFCRWCA